MHGVHRGSAFEDAVVNIGSNTSFMCLRMTPSPREAEEVGRRRLRVWRKMSGLLWGLLFVVSQERRASLSVFAFLLENHVGDRELGLCEQGMPGGDKPAGQGGLSRKGEELGISCIANSLL